MANTVLGLQISRKVLKKAFYVQMDQKPDFVRMFIGNVDSTTQSYEIYKQFRGLGPAVFTPEGSNVPMEDLQVVHTGQFAPLKYTKGTTFTVEVEKTAQYKNILDATPQFAKSFWRQRCITVADLFNTGFTATDRGIAAGETLFSTTHNSGGTVGSNTGTAAALSPLSLQNGVININQQVDASGTPMMYDGGLKLFVPPALWPRADEICKTTRGKPDTNDNTYNWLSGRVTPYSMGPFLTSSTAWFLRADNNDDHGLTWLNQMGYTVEELPLTQSLVYPWLAYESYTAFWIQYQGTYGNLGA